MPRSENGKLYVYVNLYMYMCVLLTTEKCTFSNTQVFDCFLCSLFLRAVTPCYIRQRFSDSATLHYSQNLL